VRAKYDHNTTTQEGEYAPLRHILRHILTGSGSDRVFRIIFSCEKFLRFIYKKIKKIISVQTLVCLNIVTKFFVIFHTFVTKISEMCLLASKCASVHIFVYIKLDNLQIDNNYYRLGCRLSCSFIVDGLAVFCVWSHYMFRPIWPSSGV
jgi:hypothetical protein